MGGAAEKSMSKVKRQSNYPLYPALRQLDVSFRL